jgi:hypothetical protein
MKCTSRLNRSSFATATEHRFRRASASAAANCGIVRGLRQGLSEDDRYAVADHVVSQLKERGDPWCLDDEAKPKRGPTT